MRALGLLALTATLALVVPATAAAPKTATYTGKATGVDGKFRYGAVTMKVKGTRLQRLEIKAVTTTGCGGFMTVVIAPDAKGSKITKGSATIRGGKLSLTYVPTSDVDDQATQVKATITGHTVKGTFSSGEVCSNAGKFTANR